MICINLYHIHNYTLKLVQLLAQQSAMLVSGFTTTFGLPGNIFRSNWKGGGPQLAGWNAIKRPNPRMPGGHWQGVLKSEGEGVLEALDILFPEQSDEKVDGASELASYDDRMSAGREAQGYLSTGQLVPAAVIDGALTYGEFDFSFFASVVRDCLSIYADESENGSLEAEARKRVFCDLGSGCGRLVIGQALAWPWRCCKGIEKVEALHNMGMSALGVAKKLAEGEKQSGGEALSPEALKSLEQMSPCDLLLGDANDPDEVELSDVDILFCYCTAFPARGDMLTELSYTLGHQLRPGTLVITTDRRLASDGPWEFAPLGERTGPNSEIGGSSTAFLWRVIRSAL
ncbi:unnamed protein product [Choristocarpus tenellus]